MKRIAILGVALAIGGCVETQEVQIAPNIYRLDTTAKDSLSPDEAGKATLVRAAQLTIAYGYTHFKYYDPQVGQSTRLAGIYTNFAAPSPYYANAMSVPMYQRTEHIAVTVIMLRATDPNAQGAFNAAQVLRENAPQ